MLRQRLSWPVPRKAGKRRIFRHPQIVILIMHPIFLCDLPVEIPVVFHENRRSLLFSHSSTSGNRDFVKSANKSISSSNSSLLNFIYFSLSTRDSWPQYTERYGEAISKLPAPHVYHLPDRSACLYCPWSQAPSIHRSAFILYEGEHYPIRPTDKNENCRTKRCNAPCPPRHGKILCPALLCKEPEPEPVPYGVYLPVYDQRCRILHSGPWSAAAEPALAAIHSHSQGNPRMADNLMTDALALGAQMDKKVITPEVILAAVGNQNQELIISGRGSMLTVILTKSSRNSSLSLWLRSQWDDTENFSLLFASPSIRFPTYYWP